MYRVQGIKVNRTRDSNPPAAPGQPAIYVRPWPGAGAWRPPFPLSKTGTPAFSGAPDVFSCIGALSLQQLGGPVQLLDTLLQLTQLFGPLIHLLLEVLYRHRAPDLDLSHGAAADGGAGAAEEVAPDPQLSPAAVPPGQQIREGLFPLRRRAVVGAVDGGDQPLQLLVVRCQLPQQLPGSSAGSSPSCT